MCERANKAHFYFVCFHCVRFFVDGENLLISVKTGEGWSEEYNLPQVRIKAVIFLFQANMELSSLQYIFLFLPPSCLEWFWWRNAMLALCLKWKTGDKGVVDQRHSRETAGCKSW